MIQILLSINALFIAWFGDLAKETKDNWSYIGASIAFVGYAYTFYRIWWGDANPNPMSWIGFGLLTAVGAAVQHLEGAGFIGALTMYLTAALCFVQGGAKFLREYIWEEHGGWKWEDFSPRTSKGFLSWLTLFLGVVCFTAFVCSKAIGLTPFWAAASATLSDLLLYGPIIFSSWSSPRDEVSFGYFMQSMKNGPAIAALPVYTPETWMYNAMLLVMNLLMITYFWWRRQVVSEEEEKRRAEKAA